MNDERAVEIVREMAKEYTPAQRREELAHARHGNSIFGSLLSIQFGMPRQYAEAAVVRALSKKGGSR